MRKTVKAKASARASVRVGATAQEIKAKRAKSAARGSKLHYDDKGAMTFAKAVDIVANAPKVNPYGKATGKALSANAPKRRQWCLDNPKSCVIVNRALVQRKAINSDNPRPENAIGKRLETLDKGKRIGYIRYLAVKKGKAPKGKNAELVILYRKAQRISVGAKAPTHPQNFVGVMAADYGLELTLI